MTETTSRWALAWFARLAPALIVAVALLAAAQHGPGAAAVTAVVVAACAALALAVLAAYVVRPAPVPATVRRRAAQLPPPLAVGAPRVPSRPRAPGRR